MALPSLLFSGSLSALGLVSSASHDSLGDTSPDVTSSFLSVCRDASGPVFVLYSHIPLGENHIGLSHLPVVPPELGWPDLHLVQLAVARSRGLVISEVAVGGQTSKQGLDKDLERGSSQKRISMGP